MTDGPDDSPGFWLWHATLRWQREITAVLAPLDLTHVQFVLLASCWWFDRHGETPNQLTLARRAGTDVKMTSQVVRKLADKGLITREIDPADTRARRLRVTPEGAALAERAVEIVEAVDRRFFTPVANGEGPDDGMKGLDDRLKGLDGVALAGLFRRLAEG